jgi:Family of unknown function (DUF6459)
VSVAPETSLPNADEQLVLLRAVDLGPPPDRGEAASGWRSTLLAELPRLRPVPSVPASAPRPAPAPVRTTRLLITEAEARGLAGAAARAVLEVLEGRRPIQRLTTMFTDRAVDAVHAMQRGGLRWPVRRATIDTVRVFLPCRDAVEACVVFRCDQRPRALALRIDREGRRWVGTAVRIG